MPVLVANDLAKAFGAAPLLTRASLAIKTGERVGLVGANGSGKSTLAKILAGFEPQDAGDISIRKGARVLYLEQEPKLGSKSARATVEEGLGAWTSAVRRHEAASAAIEGGRTDDATLGEQAAAGAEVERLGGFSLLHRVDAILGHLGIERPEQNVATMSGGERRRVALAAVLVARPELAILDEPTNHLDTATIEWLENYLAEEHEGALLLVTHDRYVLNRVVDRTLELERGEIHSYDGGWEAYLMAKAERAQHEARAEQNRQNFVRRELEWLRRSPSARTTKQKARIQRAETAIAKPTARTPRELALEIETTRTGGTIVDAKGLTIEIAGRTLVRGLDFSLVKGERIGIVGPNGAGKTSLLRTITGEAAPTAGAIVRGKNTRVAYFDQARSGLDDSLSVSESVAGKGQYLEHLGREIDVRSYLSRFLFTPEDQRKKVGALSGGERARVLLAKLMLEKTNLLVLDEPTNDLDVDTLSALESLIVEMEGTALIVTHDRYFLDRVATGILAFEGDGRVTRYAGGYEDYRVQRDARPRESTAAPKEKRSAAPPPPVAEKKKGLTYGERIELDAIVAKIDAADAQVAALEAELGDPSIYASRGNEVPALVAKLDAARALSAQLAARWEELELKREG